MFKLNGAPTARYIAVVMFGGIWVPGPQVGPHISHCRGVLAKGQAYTGHRHSLLGCTAIRSHSAPPLGACLGAFFSQLGMQ